MNEEEQKPAESVGEEEGAGGEKKTTIENDNALVQFQEITHLDDLDECRVLLESTNWNLDLAVQSYFTTSSFANQEMSTQMQMPSMPSIILNTNSIGFEHINHHFPSSVLPQDLIDSFSQTIMPSSNRLLTFHIEYLANKFTLHVPDNEKIKKLKELICEQINVPIDEQKLNGFRNKGMFIRDEYFLRDLNLPQETHLSVNNLALLVDDTKTLATSTLPGSSSVDEDSSFELYLKIINTNNQVTFINQTNGDESRVSDLPLYHLKFDGSERFIDIRRRVALLTGVLTASQEWWFYLNSEPNELEMSALKAANNLGAFHRIIESEKLFTVPLTNMIEDNETLSYVKKTLEEMTNPNNENVKMASTSSASNSNNFNQLNSAINSKLTPKSESIQTTVPVKSNSNKMIFVITIKQDPNQPHQNHKKARMSGEGDEEVDEDAEMSSSLLDIQTSIGLDDEEDLDHFISSQSDLQTKQAPLISKDCDPNDEIACTKSIVVEFTNRYGPCVPLFFEGTMEDAIREALLCPAKDRKLLGIYLHSDHTIYCNIFCSKTLCDENVVTFLSANFMVWPWDLTNKENEKHFYETCSKYLGSVFVSNLKSSKDKLPAFLIVTRVRSNNEVAAIIESDTATNESMMHRLMQAYEMFESQRIKDEQDEQTRDEREKIKREQDAAYHASLEFDKAKRQRQTEKDEKLAKEKQAEQKKEMKRLEALEVRKKVAAQSLPHEPSEQEVGAKIRFRLPTGDTLQRAFLKTHKLSDIINFACMNGYFVEEFKILTSWPRKDLTCESPDATIEQLKLFPQETLTFEQR